MAMTVQITQLENDVASLRQHAAHAGEASVARRLLALALVLEGHSRAEGAKNCGMDRQTLRDWVIRYNEHGIPGQGYRIWLLANCPRRRLRNSSFHPARLSFPFIEPLDPSNLARLRASRRRRAIFSGP
jgi:hypothetical protein